MNYHIGFRGESRLARRTPEGVDAGTGERPAELHWIGPGEAQIVWGDTVHRVYLREDGGRWHVQVRGRTFELSVEDERTHAIRRMAEDAVPGAGTRDLRAPMPGLVIRVLVEPGQFVEAGAPLVVVEAMKMENELRAEGPGTVATVAVTAGEAVNREDVLVTFEAEAE